MNYHNITHDDMLNGEGLRVVLWVAGCDHHCEECQNPETWDPNSGITFDEAAKEELFYYLNKPYIAGITFSGGDPLNWANKETIESLIDEIKEKFPDKNIWLYTGYTYDDIKSKYPDLERIINKVDVLVDGPFIKSKADIKYEWAGSTNQKIINMHK